MCFLRVSPQRMQGVERGRVALKSARQQAPAAAAVRPPRGNLVFCSTFESGNLGKVEELVPQSEYDLQIQPDTHNHRYRVWFYFSVSNVRKKQAVLFNVTNFSKAKSLYREGMTPLVRSTSRSYWQRVPTKNTFYYKCPRHNMSYALSFLFEFDLEDDIYYFAYCYPYTYTDLQVETGRPGQDSDSNTVQNPLYGESGSPPRVRPNGAFIE